MRLLLTTIFAAFFSSVIAAQAIRLSEPVAKDANSETFGTVIDQSLKSATMASLVTASESHLGAPFKLTTQISKVCQKKGCFFIAQQDDHVLRVSFKDYGFFIPTDSSGKTVTLTGELVKKTLSPEQAAHYRADLNEQSDSIKSGVVYQIVANGIQIPLN